ncbi:hypothetical protein OGATHE_001404 [Ogataea polymorpha]|uniref:Uncharacterized protein n=1 Tax=Ogataea polymorpha TaxID=460523 RepID=A0A9P8PT13_9ASCO|nr:hypothetical protein OGATHE_001404 [Ogataea polymorpha]
MWRSAVPTTSNFCDESIANSATGENARSEIESSGPLGTTMSFCRSWRVPADVTVPVPEDPPRELVPNAPSDRVPKDICPQLQQSIADAGLLLAKHRARRFSVRLHRSSGGLQQHALVGRDGVGQSDRVLLDIQLHKHLVGLLQVALLSQSLDSVDQFSDKTLRLQLWVHVDVQNDQHVSLGSDLLAARDFVFWQTSEHRQVLVHKLLLDVALQCLDIFKVAWIRVQHNKLPQRGFERYCLLFSDVSAQVDDLLHSGHGKLNFFVDQRVVDDRVRQEVHRVGVFAVFLQRLLLKQHLYSAVDVLGQIWRERSHGSHESEQRFGQRIHGLQTVLDTILSLQSLSVEPDVPVGQLVNQIQQLRNNRVQSRSMTFSDLDSGSYLKSIPSFFLSKATCPSRNLYEFHHGSRTLETTSLTPSSLNLSVSALKTGELIKYNLRASAPYLSQRANTDNLLEIFRNPQGQWSAPVSLSRDVPVSGIGNPVGKSFILYVGRNPSGSVHSLQHLGNDVLDSHKPRRNRSIKQRSVGSPAEWVAVSDLGRQQNPTGGSQILDDFLVGVLNVESSKVGHFLSESSVVVDRVRRSQVLIDDACLGSSLEIDLTKSRCLVDNTGTGVVCDKGVAVHSESGVFELVVEIVERRLTFQHDVGDVLLLVVDLGILKLGMHTEANIRRQGPRSGGPGNKNSLWIVF